jgi:hypothetical protein
LRKCNRAGWRTNSPLSGEAGVYTVRAVHPDLTDKPVHGTFAVNKLAVSPTLAQTERNSDNSDKGSVLIISER